MQASPSSLWVPLHVHSQYSILDSSLAVTTLAETAKRYLMPAVALTDQGNLYGAVEFFKACKQVGITPLIGCELFVAPFSRLDKKRIPNFSAGYPIILLVQNQKGYENLCHLSSMAHIEGFYYTPRIDKELLAAHSEGLICLSGPLSSMLSTLLLQEKQKEALEEISWYQKVFPDRYYFEVQRHPMREEDIRKDGMDREPWAYQKYQEYIYNQEKVLRHLVELSKTTGIPCVATNDTHYLNREDWQAHEILMNIQSGEPCEIWEKDSFGNNKVKILNPKRQMLPSHEFYFKTSEEMHRLFADLPEALTNTLLIANSCTFELDCKTRYYPVFVPPHLEGVNLSKEERAKEAETYLRKLCSEGIEKRYTPSHLEKVQEKYPGKDPLTVVKERLAYELEIITSKGMGDYLLIVYDFIAWAKKHTIPVGPGRGSGAGSIILYLLEITDIEPLRFNLFFERFINPERISYPDIDVDICMDRRSEVIEYTVQKYGKDKVAQIITFGTMKAKMAIKDVGRVLSIPLSKVNAIAKLVPEELNITIDRALETDPELRLQYETDTEVGRLIDLAKKLEGCVRNTGIHAAGLIISADPITQRIPVCVAKDAEMLVTQYSMKPVESVGMLKIDFLGLKTLTSVQRTVEAIKAAGGPAIDWVNLPLEDQATFALLNQGRTLGLFQIESSGMQDLARQLRIDKFEEIIAVGALYRPGPMEMIPSFINRKHGKESLEIDHPLMEDILNETYGIMVYQEQVMQIASRLANYTLGEGDVLRRAMGKKDREEMARQREKFRLGALQNGIDSQTSMRIFDKVEKFASYGFNKSHAAAYGYLTYVTAYLKANYPREWMASLMTSDRDDLSKVAKVIRESQAMEIAILSPDVNESGKEFIATPKGIRFALTAIKGIGAGVVEAILEERKKAPFQSLADFIKRIDTAKVGKKAIEHLVEAGCFDFTKKTRQEMLKSVDTLHALSAKEQKDRAKGFLSLFSLLQEEPSSAPPPTLPTTPQLGEEELLQVTQYQLRREKELLGFYLTGHPLEEFREKLQKLSCVSLKHLSESAQEGGVYRTAFIIESVQTKIASRSQRKFALLTISDSLENFTLPIWPELYEEKYPLLVENQLIYAVLVVEKEGGELKLQCRWLDDLTRVDEAALQSCDTAYDRAKMQSKLSLQAYTQNKAPSPAKNKPTPEVSSSPTKEESAMRLFLKLAADTIRFTQILEIKDLFRSYPGKNPIVLTFQSEKELLGEVHISSNWGVAYDPSLEQKLQAIPGVIQVQFQKEGS